MLHVLKAELVRRVESSKGVSPVFEGHVGFLVRVDFTEQFLKEFVGHVEATEKIAFLYKGFELRKVYFIGTLTGFLEALLDGSIPLGHSSPKLLDRSHLPVVNPRLLEATTHSFREILLGILRRFLFSVRVWLIAQKPLEVTRMQGVSLKETN